MDRVDVVHENFLQRVADGDLPPAPTRLRPADAGMDHELLLDIFRAQVTSRHLDRVSRQMQARGEGFYTIGSSGHEGNAAIACAFRPTDMAFLHYRDAAFQIARSQQVPDQDPVRDMLLSFAISADDPISGGRHKVLGSKRLAIPPQTSTVASHLPKAVGAAFSIATAKRIEPEHRMLESDGVVLCSFGDASVNHSTAQGAFNTAGWTAFQGIPLPLVFICEDNGIGISVRTPTGWIEATMANRPGLGYYRCDGLDIVDTYSTALAVAAHVRRTRRPAFLHMSCVRLYGHAGADAPIAYMSIDEIEAEEADDPLLHSARTLVEHGGMTRAGVLRIYVEIGDAVAATAGLVVQQPRLTSAEQVMASIVPPARACRVAAAPTVGDRRATFGEADAKALEKPQNMARLINFALTDIMLEYPEVVVAGEDVGAKGGVYGVTRRLQQRFGRGRVIDTILDEQSILGLAIGMAHNGLVPIPEIQFLAYLHNAEDQIRGEAATLSFFSNGQFTNPMVVRIPGLGYQRGFGGHFHNDNSLAVLRDIPGVVIACPSNGADAVRMLRECVSLAREEQQVVVFIEPIARYTTQDLLEPGDGRWAHIYPTPGRAGDIACGEIGVIGDGTDLAVVTYGNGTFLSCQAQHDLADRHGVASRVIDLRWLAPLPGAAIHAAVEPCRRILVVDECRVTGSTSEAILGLFVGETKPVGRVAAADSFIATGPAYAATLPSRQAIVEAARELAVAGPTV